MPAQRKVAIVARGGTGSLAPFSDRRWEIWGMPWIPCPWLDAAFELHSQQFYEEGPDNWLKRGAWIDRFEKEQAHATVYCDPSRTHLFRNGVDFPLDAVSSAVPIPYLENSLAYMIAFAIFQNQNSSIYGPIDEIGLWGVHMQAGPEAELAHASVLYMIGVAQGRGIKVTVAPGAPLFMSSYVDGRYGTRNGAAARRPKFVTYAGISPYK